MRLSKIKFNQIQELNGYINLLKETRDYITNKFYETKTKLDRFEYAEIDDELFAVTKDELLKSIISYEKENERLNYIIYITNLELKAVTKDKDIVLNEYNDFALSLKYRSNKKEQKLLTIGTQLLGKTIESIKYRIDQKKDRFHFVLSFTDGTILQRYIFLDSVIMLMVKN